MVSKPGIIIIACICNAIAMTATAQSDTTIVMQRNGIVAQFSYQKYRNRAELRNARLPVYTTSRNNIARLSAILNEYTKVESQFNALVKENHNSDSLFAAKEQTFLNTIELEKQRAGNFEDEKNKILAQYNQLNGLLTNTIQEAENARKSSWWRGAKQVGVPALAVGALIGILVAR